MNRDHEDVLIYPVNGKQLSSNMSFMLFPNMMFRNRVTTLDFYQTEKKLRSLLDAPQATSAPSALSGLQIYAHSQNAEQTIEHLVTLIYSSPQWRSIIALIRDRIKPHALLIDEEREDGSRLCMFVVTFDNCAYKVDLTEAVALMKSINGNGMNPPVWYTVDKRSENSVLGDIENHKKLFKEGTLKSYRGEVEAELVLEQHVSRPGVTVALHVLLPAVRVEVRDTITSQMSDGEVVSQLEKDVIRL